MKTTVREEAAYNTALHAAYAAGNAVLAHKLEREHLEALVASGVK